MTVGAFVRYKWPALCRARPAEHGVGLQAETANGGLDRFGAGCYRAGQLPGECQLPRFDLMKRVRAGNDRTDLASATGRSEEHTSELQSLMRISYAVFCLKKNNHHARDPQDTQQSPHYK